MLVVYLSLVLAAPPLACDETALRSRLVLLEDQLSRTEEGWGTAPTAMAIIGFGVGPLALGGGLFSLGFSQGRSERVMAGVSLVSLAVSLVIGAISATLAGREQVRQRQAWLEEKSSLESQLEPAERACLPADARLLPQPGSAASDDRPSWAAKWRTSLGRTCVASTNC